MQVTLKSDKNNGYFTSRLFTFIAICRLIPLEIRNVLGKVVEKIKTHFIFKNVSFPKSCVYEIMSKNMVVPGTHVFCMLDK